MPTIKTDIEIAQENKPNFIGDVAREIGIPEDHLELY